MPVDDKTIFFVTRKIWLTAVGWKSNSNSLRNVDWATCFGLSFNPLKQPLASSPCHRFPLQLTPHHHLSTLFAHFLIIDSKCCTHCDSVHFKREILKHASLWWKTTAERHKVREGRGKVRDPTVHTKQRQNEGGTAEKKKELQMAGGMSKNLQTLREAAEANFPSGWDCDKWSVRGVFGDA